MYRNSEKGQDVIRPLGRNTKTEEINMVVKKVANAVLRCCKC